MSLLDRYIARQYLFNVIALMVILATFVVAVDVTINIGRFTKMAGEMITEQAGATPEGEAPPEPGAVRRGLVAVLLVLDLWWPRLIQLFTFLNGMVLVGAMGFTCTQLVRNRELIAVMASGQSLQRIGRSVIVVALGFTALQACVQEFVLPQIAPLLTRDTRDAGRRGFEVTEVPLIADGQGRVWLARRFDAGAETLEGIRVLERDDEGRPVRVILADGATWAGDRWLFENGRAERRRADAAAPEPVAELRTSLDPTRLRMERFKGYSTALSFAQAGTLLSRTDLLDDEGRARLERIRYGRFAIMAANLLSLVIALPFFLTREPKNMAIQALRCTPISVIALVGGVLGASAAVPGVPAALGVFIPVMLLLPIAIVTVTSFRT